MKRQTDIMQFFSSTGRLSSSKKPISSKTVPEVESKIPQSKRVNEQGSMKSVDIAQFSKSLLNEDENGNANIKSVRKVNSRHKKRVIDDDESDYEPELDPEPEPEPEPELDPDPDSVCDFAEEKKSRSKSNPKPKKEQGFFQEAKKLDTKKLDAGKQNAKYDKEKWELPAFIKPENIKDKNKRRPDDPDYDNTSVYIPDQAFAGMTATVKQYWKIKQANMDKIVLFKLGKFYEIFNEDAIICHKLLDLNWTGPLHVGFPEKCLEKYGGILVNNGMRVIVAEQMETPKDMKKRLQETKGHSKKDEKTIKREVCQVFSKGLFIDNSDNNYEAKYLLTIYTDHSNTIGVAILDIAALNIKIGQFEDDSFWCKFRTLSTRLRPVEVVYNKDTFKPELKKILQNSPIIPMFSTLGKERGEYNYIKSIPLLEKYFGYNSEEWPEVIVTAKKNTWQHAISALGILIAYLEDSLLAQQTIITSEYEIFDLDTSIMFTMTMDSQAFQHLEILEVQGMTKNITQGSLLDYLDKTITPFGKRELKRWLCAPLYEIEEIKLRQDAVTDLIMNDELLYAIRKTTSTFPDFEKKISRLYTYSVKQEKSPIFFENMNMKKLRELKEVLDGLEKVERLYKSFSSCKKEISSKRLRQLTRYVGDRGGIVPKFYEKIKEFKGIIDWSELEKRHSVDQVPEPNGGVDAEYDDAKECIKEAKEELNEELIKWQKFFGDKSIHYVHKKEV